MKGEPPPTITAANTTQTDWINDILQEIEYNDNAIVLPQVNLVFEQDALPIFSDQLNHNNIYTYQDTSGHELDHTNIFVPIHETVPTSIVHGHIISDSIFPQHPDIQKLTTIPQTSYICGPPSHPCIHDTTLESHISAMINSTNNNGLYELNINTHVQNDSGANRSVTNLISLLHDYRQIEPYPIAGVNSDAPAIYCTGFGYLKWYSKDRELILVPCYYCENASGTIISPTDIVYSHRDNFIGWQMTTNLDNKSGTFMLLARDGVNHIRYPTFMRNNLWYHYLFVPNATQEKHISTPIIRSLNTSASYEIWHHRLGHPGMKVSQHFHDNTIGVPHLKPNKFYSCGSCVSCKFHNRTISRLGELKKVHTLETSINKLLDDTSINVGQHLHMDYGFVRGSNWALQDNDGKLVTSIDKYRAYLLVIDKHTRYIWIFLTKDKSPPITQVQSLLSRFPKYKLPTIMTDQGGELSRSLNFKKMCEQYGYILQTTGAYASQQNGLAEKPNKDLAQIMRCLLYSAGLDSKFWSYAIRHSVYLKNRWPHSSLHWKTPYEMLHKTKPDLTHLRVFGALVNTKSTAKRYMKLDPMTKQGLFMTYSGTDKNVYVVDLDGTNERLSTHLMYDEAHMSSTNSTLPPMAITLQQRGFYQSLTNQTPIQPTSLKVCLNNSNARIPTKATPESAGYDMYSAENITIDPHSHILINTHISMEIPSGHFGMLKSRSGLAYKHNLHVQAGIIDADYRGEIKILLSNESNVSFEVTTGMRIAQLIIFKQPKFEIVNDTILSKTKRDANGFGSTGLHDDIDATTLQQHDPPTHAAAASMSNTTPMVDDDNITKYNVICSSDPFTDYEDITIPVRGKHITQGFVLQQCEYFNQHVIIKAIQPGTGPRNIKQWIRRIKHCHLLQINHINITSPKQAYDILKNISKNDKKYVIRVSQDQRNTIHHDHGLPMLYFDQLSTIARHLDNIKTLQDNISENPIDKIDKSTVEQERYLTKILNTFKKYGTIRAVKSIIPKNKRSSKKLTRRKLKSMPTWNEWRLSEHKQLDQYQDQGMFGKPCKLPPGANVLDLLWTYVVKTDGTKKARCVCNGQPRFKGTVIFGYTFAKMLDHVGSRIFWGSVAAKNLIVRGADASNAFAEASAPDIPLYVRVDTQYREWYKERFNIEIPPNHVLPVQKALQGHPESSRSWAIHMDRILRTKFHLKPTTHEGCLYRGTYKNEEILFLRQVDDFAVAATNEQTATSLIHEIDSHMTIDIKDLGLLTRYNGVDICQSKYYVKLSNATYIEKLLEEHEWLLADDKTANLPLPVKNDTTFNQRLENAIPPSNPKEQTDLQSNMGFNYRQAIGELIFLMITCRPDISFPLIKLSQYSNNPAMEHYEAVKQIFRYIKTTKHDGIYFWRKRPRNDLPFHKLPITVPQTHLVDHDSQCDDPDKIHAASDSDWGGDSNHRKSVSGIIIKYAGGTIYYKTKFQDTIAMSSTEAEFVAACEAGKAILYIRSILDEINIPQDEATTLFIDNNGALLMANAQQPTRRTRHMDIKHFALLDWVERDLIVLKRINTTDNYSDAMTKSLGRQLYYRHNDYILGKIIPKYAAAYSLPQPLTTV